MGNRLHECVESKAVEHHVAALVTQFTRQTLQAAHQRLGARRASD
jgi:hypothetical protein